MESLKSGFGVMRAVMPLLYCGGLYYYFSSGTFGPVGPMSGSASPNILVLMCAGGLIFSIPLILNLVRIFARARAAGPAGAVGDEVGGFDPDAAIARYMADRPVEDAATPAARPAYTGAPAKPSGFGRRGR